MTATTVSVDVPPVEIEPGFAVMVTAAALGALLPLKSAHPVRKKQNGRKLASKRKDLTRVVHEVTGVSP